MAGPESVPASRRSASLPAGMPLQDCIHELSDHRELDSPSWWLWCASALLASPGGLAVASGSLGFPSSVPAVRSSSTCRLSSSLCCECAWPVGPFPIHESPVSQGRQEVLKCPAAPPLAFLIHAAMSDLV